MAIPLFIFAGFLMERTGLVAQLFRFADALVGWLPGGFGVATVLACVLFGAISGLERGDGGRDERDRDPGNDEARLPAPGSRAGWSRPAAASPS